MTKPGDFCARVSFCRLRLSLGCCVASILATTLVVGCQKDSERQAVEGTVTLDAEPLAEGGIRLVPKRGTNGPSTGGPIREGRYSIARDKGPFAGEFKVEITATRDSGKILNHPDEGPVPITEQYIPARYNTQTELSATVKAGEPNVLNFDLISKGDQ